MISIIPYRPSYASAFKALNLEWLDAYHLTESHDLQVLDDPQGTIITRGGVIILAVEGEELVGSAALMPLSAHIFELAKMAVAPAHRGKGIGKKLMESILEEAEKLDAKKISLFTNHQLTTAINLYKTFGFKQIQVTDSPFVTADVKMELTL